MNMMMIYLYRWTTCKKTHMQVLAIKVNYLNYPPHPAVLPQIGDASSTEINFAQRRKLFGIRGVVLVVEAQYYVWGP
jgi:hypothetical protein